MLKLQHRVLPEHRTTAYYHARYRLLRENSEFFCMGLRLPDDEWLSILCGWRLNQVTYVDFQMNDMHYKKESISAVMRAFLLEHEIACKQKSIHFVGGTSLLLKRYCRPIEFGTDCFFWRPCLRSRFLEMIASRLKPGSLHERAKGKTENESPLSSL